ncbi:hypothetical protein Clacol_004082 [Clathrus columnatus]|uniref:Zn(2)-C6 fungal-type domain-containing protein n=1 Tax=Clathrus columnatus TaxID=1419009 RepID=A0AAV5A8S0_9AGAM|nr:hypothetical protein Clacol_004082 [Clathrus columnatus]
MPGNEFERGGLEDDKDYAIIVSCLHITVTRASSLNTLLFLTQAHSNSSTPTDAFTKPAPMLSGGFFPHHHNDDQPPIHPIVFFAEEMSNPHTHHTQMLQMQQMQQQPQQQHPQFSPDPPHQIHRNNVDTSQPYPNSAQKTENSSPPSNDLMKAGSSEEKKPLIKPTKTLNRVPRACNACRKQKMRCEGAESPPCRRCRHAGLECLFEKPTREPTLTGEAGLDHADADSFPSQNRRIRSLESQVSDIRTTQHNIHTTLLELVAQLRGGVAGPSSSYRQSPVGTSPYTNNNVHSPASSGTATITGTGMAIIDPGESAAVTPGVVHSRTGSIPTGGHGSPATSNVMVNTPSMKRSSSSVPSNYHGPASSGQFIPGRSQQSFQSLPSLYTLQDSSKKDNNKRNISSSNDTSANSSEDEDSAELPASGLVAPWEVLRGLAEAAAEISAKARSNGHRPKRRKINHRHGRALAPPDGSLINLIVNTVISHRFYQGCSTFLPVFDSQTDTFDELHERSPFAVDCICMVAARVQCGGGPPTETFKKCLEEVQSICSRTLFSPVKRQEVVQAMVLVSGWSDNGWLSGGMLSRDLAGTFLNCEIGHAVRMALEIGMNKAWPKILRRIYANRTSTSQEERELVISARTWLVLYLFEHQISYGVGRPAILRFDESIRDCRLLLQHPLAIEDDLRLVSMVELMVIREKIHNRLAQQESITEETFLTLREADNDFKVWFEHWDQKFGEKYSDSVFYRQSLQVQQLFAELFHNATALVGVNGPEDVAKMPPAQRQIAIRSINIAKLGLETTLRASAYRENLKYAVHYTHATATFAASFLIRLARLIPQECDLHAIKKDIEELANVLEQRYLDKLNQPAPAGRYARSLRFMLRRAAERRVLPDDSPRRLSRDIEFEESPDLQHMHPAVAYSQPQQAHSQYRSPPPQQYVGQMHPQQHHQSHQNQIPSHPMAYGPSPPGIYAGSIPVQTGWYDPYNNEMQPWENMDLNAGAVMVDGMEAYMIPVGYGQPGEDIQQIW